MFSWDGFGPASRRFDPGEHRGHAAETKGLIQRAESERGISRQEPPECQQRAAVEDR